MTCHTEITDLMNLNRGYHSNPDVITKNCWECHGEHYGRTFQIIRFDESKFDHNKSGFILRGSHTKLECSQCHKSEFIIEEKIKAKKKTYLGLSPACSNCHTDTHQGTLNKQCSNCHNEEKFKPAILFSHEKTNFRLTGSHIIVDCIKCHQKEIRNNKPFQKFADVKFKSCSNCHSDFHNGKFGNDCQSCHNTSSFHDVEILNGFNHSKTNFPLFGKHKKVKCENCHKGNLTNKPTFTKCYDCHEDYHKGEFVKNNIKSDCKECHTEMGFSPSTFTIEKHAKTKFELTYSHAATPCIVCHRTDNDWKFRLESEKCIDCHENIHGNEISEKYFDENKCETCHSSWSWKNVDFKHNKTDFQLLGKHKNVSCSDCHFVYNKDKVLNQRFSSLDQGCLQCHKDFHYGQFVENGKELCEHCHTFEDWNPVLFDHNNTRFSLNGAHKNLSCSKCHKEIEKGEVSYTNYKIKDVTCKSCHS